VPTRNTRDRGADWGYQRQKRRSSSLFDDCHRRFGGFGAALPRGRILFGGPMNDESFAISIGLRPVEPDEPGIRRLRWGQGFTYRWPDGQTVTGADRDRCEALVLPPAWDDVWICMDPAGHLQARGRDDAGRWQYRYHDRWTEARRLANFDRLREVGARLKPVRKQIALDLEKGELVARALAAMLRLVDQSLGRIGNEASAEVHDTTGISTLASEHVEVAPSGVLELSFVGKSSVEHASAVKDAELAEVIAQLEDEGGQRLFSVDFEGDVVRLTARDANQRLAELSSGKLSCKDFRTWGGSAVALEARIEGKTETAIIDAAAEALNNTRAIARSAYVHPTVVEADDDRLHDAWRGARRSKWYERRERALLRLLDSMPTLLAEYAGADPPADP